VQESRTKHAEVEYLVTRSTEVKLAWRAPLRAPDHVYDCTLDVDIAA